MPTAVCTDAALARYNFGSDHPFGPARFGAFYDKFKQLGLADRTIPIGTRVAEQAQIERFHSHDYVEKVKLASMAGSGYLDSGDTPAFPGVYEVSALVVGTCLHAMQMIMDNECQRAFVPIAGLHHARRDSAAGFCVFNDCGVVIETLLKEYKLQRVAYIDIDAHHGDGVYYGFESEPGVVFADLHEDGRFLYPGTGAITESGKAAAKGLKLNVPLPMGADDEVFDGVWPKVESFIEKHQPEFILLQCGADSLKGDPITHMAFSRHAHATAAARLCELADQHCDGRLLALGGGGYNLGNIADAWTAVVESLIAADK